MSVFFADSSALVKRYITEIGSAWVRGWALPVHGNIVVISEIAAVELVSAFARRRREGSLTAAAFDLLRNNFLLHTEREYLTVRLERDVLRRAGDVAARHPLRTLDAIQLACALDSVQTLGLTPTFVSADRNLLIAAATEGFPTGDPNAHP